MALVWVLTIGALFIDAARNNRVGPSASALDRFQGLHGLIGFLGGAIGPLTGVIVLISVVIAVNSGVQGMDLGSVILLAFVGGIAVIFRIVLGLAQAAIMVLLPVTNAVHGAGVLIVGFLQSDMTANWLLETALKDAVPEPLILIAQFAVVIVSMIIVFSRASD